MPGGMQQKNLQVNLSHDLHILFNQWERNQGAEKGRLTQLGWVTKSGITFYMTPGYALFPFSLAHILSLSLCHVSFFTNGVHMRTRVEV